MKNFLKPRVLNSQFWCWDSYFTKAVFFCMMGLPLFGKEDSWTPVFKILVSALIRVSNKLNPDEVRHFVKPDLVPNCLEELSANDTSRQRAKIAAIFYTVD